VDGQLALSRLKARQRPRKRKEQKPFADAGLRQNENPIAKRKWSIPTTE
jgi:hypothetical protein